MTDQDRRELVKQLTEKLNAVGKLIESGWRCFELMVLMDDAPQVRKSEMRQAFFAGAQHLFASIIAILDPGTEPTEKDLERLTLINDELKRFVEELKKGT